MALAAPAGDAAVTKAEILTKATVKTAASLGITKSRLAQILGVSRGTVTRLYSGAYILSPTKKEWEFGVLLVRLFASLDSIVGGSAADARTWLQAENAAFAGAKPVEMIGSIQGLVRVVTYLDTCRGLMRRPALPIASAAPRSPRS